MEYVQTIMVCACAMLVLWGSCVIRKLSKVMMDRLMFRSSRLQMFIKIASKALLKVSKSSQENICVGVSF